MNDLAADRLIERIAKRVVEMQKPVKIDYLQPVIGALYAPDIRAEIAKSEARVKADIARNFKRYA